MGMLPVFIIGIVMGCIFSYVYSLYKKDTPSEVKLKLLEAEIISLKNDNAMLERCIQKKDVAITQLKQDIESFETKK